MPSASIVDLAFFNNPDFRAQAEAQADGLDHMPLWHMTSAGLVPDSDMPSSMPTEAPFAPLLPVLPYHDDQNAAPKSIQLLEAQASIAGWTERNPGERMTASRCIMFVNLARDPTEPQRPPPIADSIRLVYFMRECGHAVYTKIEPQDREVTFWLEEQKPHRLVRTMWMTQNWVTGECEADLQYHRERDAAERRRAQRNAAIERPTWDLIPEDPEWTELLNEIQELNSSLPLEDQNPMLDRMNLSRLMNESSQLAVQVESLEARYRQRHGLGPNDRILPREREPAPYPVLDADLMDFSDDEGIRIQDAASGPPRHPLPLAAGHGHLRPQAPPAPNSAATWPGQTDGNELFLDVWPPPHSTPLFGALDNLSIDGDEDEEMSDGGGSLSGGSFFDEMDAAIDDSWDSDIEAADRAIAAEIDSWSDTDSGEDEDDEDIEVREILEDLDMPDGDESFDYSWYD